jgi:hypothetical protein
LTPANPVVTWLMLNARSLLQPHRGRVNRAAHRRGADPRRHPEAMRVNLHRRLEHAPSARSYACRLWATVDWSSHP